jgi:hypothetical protein
MADRIGTMEGTLQRLVGKSGGPAPASRAQLEQRQMLLETDIAIDF